MTWRNVWHVELEDGRRGYRGGNVDDVVTRDLLFDGVDAYYTPVPVDVSLLAEFPAHIRMCLVELHAIELAEVSFHNRGGQPAVRWCLLDDMPTRDQAEDFVRAARVWYLTFDPVGLLEFPKLNRLEIEGCHDAAVGLWLDHRTFGRPCVHCEYLPQLN
jgi:hypothetical protein